MLRDGVELPRISLFHAKSPALVHAGIPPSSIGRFRKYLKARFPDVADQCQDSAGPETELDDAAGEVLSPHGSETPSLPTPSPVEQAVILPHFLGESTLEGWPTDGHRQATAFHGHSLNEPDNPYLAYLAYQSHQLYFATSQASLGPGRPTPHSHIPASATSLPVVPSPQGDLFTCGGHSYALCGNAEAMPSAAHGWALTTIDSDLQAPVISAPPNEGCHHDPPQHAHAALTYWNAED
ncbi:hypothetical protein AURDEDRAFT_163627 [Auricularia subglabra TFB-10046 SS5]|nr:hypothetical protein AURDEDRAFT_163627 [Auricularia subglabra TFB-10046 SS5]